MEHMYSYFLSILNKADAVESRVSNLLRQMDLNPDLDQSEQQEKIDFKARYGIIDEIEKIERSV